MRGWLPAPAAVLAPIEAVEVVGMDESEAVPRAGEAEARTRGQAISGERRRMSATRPEEDVVRLSVVRDDRRAIAAVIEMRAGGHFASQPRSVAADRSPVAAAVFGSIDDRRRGMGGIEDHRQQAAALGVYPRRSEARLLG